MKTFKPILIGIADAHPYSRMGIINYLNKTENIKVVLEAKNGTDLLHQLQTTSDKRPDIVILDIPMSDMDGYSALATIKEQHPYIRVIMLSMLDTEYPVINTLINGASGFVSKKEPPHKLKEAILQVSQIGQYFSEKINKYIYYNNGGIKSNFLTLTKREKTFLSYCCNDITYKDIARLMHISPRSVENYRNSLFKKLNVKNRIGLVLFAIKSGLYCTN